MSRDTNVTDRWVGHYILHGEQWPIAAELVQAGERLTGSMTDGVTDKEYSVTELAREAGLPPGGDEQIVDRLRRMFPDAPATEVRYVTHLPPDSALQGFIKGPEVYFLKTYEGSHYGGYQIGDKLVGFEKESHAVHYGGRISSDGREIAGKWWIENAPGDGSRRAEGSFTLRREEGGDISKRDG
jgi:hypothetical protein